MKKTKLLVSLILGIAAIFCGYIAKTNAIELNIDDLFFTGSILTGNYAEIHFQENSNDGYGIFFVGSGKAVNATLNLSGGNYSMHCNKQLNGYYIIPYTNYQVLGLDPVTVEYTNNERTDYGTLTENITFVTGGLFYDCVGISPAQITNENMTGIYGYIKREYGSDSDVKNTHEIRAGLSKKDSNWIWTGTSSLQQVYSTTTGNHSRTLSGQFYSSLARSGLVSPRPIGDLKFTNGRNITYSGASNQYDISVYEYAEVGINLQILSAKPDQTGRLELTYFDRGSPSQQRTKTINIQNHSSINNFGFLGETGYSITKTNVQTDDIEPGTTGEITLIYPGENGNPDRSFTINFRITDENFRPCLTGYDHKFLTQDFWNQSPTNYNIKCAIFGYSGDSGYGTYRNYKTAYTSGRNGYESEPCTTVTVEITGGLPSNGVLEHNTIYVLSGNSDEIKINNIIMGKCSAIVSPSKLNIGNDVTLTGGSITFNGESKHSVLDNISIKGGGISFNNGSHDNTLNMVKIYNANNGIYLDRSNNILLNNIQSFNNDYGIYILGSNNNAINNTQIYRNNTGIYMEESRENIIHNSAINQNIIGVYLTTGSNHNILTGILINNNKDNAGNKGLFIKHGLQNTGINIKLGKNQGGKNYFMEYTGNGENLDGYQTSMEITGYVWTMKKSPKKYPYIYYCKGGTSGTCFLQASGDYYLYQCSGTRRTADEDEQNASYRSISANGILYANDGTNIGTRNLNITSGTQAIFQANSIEKNITGTLKPIKSGFIFTRFSGGNNNYQDDFVKCELKDDNTATMEYKLSENIDPDILEYIPQEDGKKAKYIKIYTGTRYEIFDYIEFTGSYLISEIDKLGNYLCEKDGNLSGSSTEEATRLPYIFHSSGYIFSNFSYNIYSGEFVNDKNEFYINHMTNPETSTDFDDEKKHTFLNGRRNRDPHGKTGINNTIKRYSYGINVKLQKDVILPGGEIIYGSVNNKFYIGSNIPKPSLSTIPGYNNTEITKVHFRLGITGNFDNMQGPIPTNYHIISLRDNGFNSTLDSVNTILQYTGGARQDRSGGQTRENDTTYGYTGNKYMKLSIGSGVDIYLKEGPTLSYYPVIYQVYNPYNYYFTHISNGSIENNALSLDFSGDNCLPPETERIDLTAIYSNYERDTTGFYEENITATRNLHSEYGVKSRGFDKIGTGKYRWQANIPCFTGELCEITENIINTTNIQDILRFNINSIKHNNITYQRDRQWPSITITTGETVDECNTHTIQLKLVDHCIGSYRYQIFSSELNLDQSGQNNNHPQTRNIKNNHIELSSGQIGRTGNKLKTGRAKGRDYYGNNQRLIGGALKTEENFLIFINDVPVTISRGLTKANHLKYTGDGIIGYYMTGGYAEITGLITGVDDAQIIINPIELLGAQEGDCGTGDLYVDNVLCYTGNLAFSGIDPRFNFTGNVLTGQIILDENGKKTQQVKIFHENKKTFDIVVCAFNIKDNETGAGVTGYIGFRVNTLHVPLISPEIVSGVKYVDYSGYYQSGYTEEDTFYFTGKTYSHNENQKYSSGDLIYINLNANDCVAEYYASCDEYYDWTGISQDNYLTDYNTGIAWNNPPYTGFYLSGCRGDDPDNFSGRQTPIRISVRNGEFTGDNGFWTNTGNTEEIIYDYTSPYTKNLRTGTKKVIVANGQTIHLQVNISDKHNINDRIPPIISQVYFTIDTGLCHKSTIYDDFIEDIESSFTPGRGSQYLNTRNLIITGTINLIDDYCEGGEIVIHIKTGFVSDFAGNPSTQLETGTNYKYTNKTAIFIKEGNRRKDTNDARVAIKSIERKEITGALNLQLLSNLPINSTGKLMCTGFNESGSFMCLTLSGYTTISNDEEELCKTRNTGNGAPSCSEYHEENMTFDKKYDLGFTICSGYNSDDPDRDRASSCTGRYSTNDTTGNWMFYAEMEYSGNKYNDDYLKIQIYRKKSPFKAGEIYNETFFYGDIKKALLRGSGDNGFVFYISHPQKIRTGSISGGTIGEITYDLNFSTGVADEFYYITGEAIVNGFKQSRSIKRPTYNYENPKSYLFNFPDYESYNE